MTRIVDDQTTLAELALYLKDLHGPLLRVWWAIGAKKWCTVFGTGVRVAAMHAESDVMVFAAERGLDVVCTEKTDDLIGRGDTIAEAINEAAFKILGARGNRYAPVR